MTSKDVENCSRPGSGLTTWFSQCTKSSSPPFGSSHKPGAQGPRHSSIETKGRRRSGCSVLVFSTGECDVRIERNAECDLRIVGDGGGDEKLDDGEEGKGTMAEGSTPMRWLEEYVDFDGAELGRRGRKVDIAEEARLHSLLVEGRGSPRLIDPIRVGRGRKMFENCRVEDDAEELGGGGR